MGMFDTIRSSYNLGKGMEGELQTKSLDCLMAEYWISPAGQLYEIDYSGTQDFCVNEQDDTPFWKGITWIPNGNHGKVRASSYYGVIEAYPANWKGQWEDWPTCQMTFCAGKIVSVTNITCRSR